MNEKKALAPGLKGFAQTLVTRENTALGCGSGLVPVFATPAMIALMEGAAVDGLDASLEEGTGSVGTKLEVRHLAATPVGMTVRAEAVLKEVEGRRLVFEVKAWDEQELIGQGLHERFLIQTEKFLAKAKAKQKK